MPSDRAAHAAFLAALGETGNVSEAARRAGLARSYVRSRRQRDADFATAWDEALEIAYEALEAEARRRAVEGDVQPLVAGGKVVTHEDGTAVTIRRYSDRLLEFLLRTRRPRALAEEPVGSIRTLTDAERAARIAALDEPQG